MTQWKRGFSTQLLHDGGGGLSASPISLSGAKELHRGRRAQPGAGEEPRCLRQAAEQHRCSAREARLGAAGASQSLP